MAGGETRCPWCQCFYPDEDIDRHKAACPDNPNK